MKKSYAVVVLLTALVFSSYAFAISEQDQEKIRTTADQYLSQAPDNGDQLYADGVLKRMQPGNDFQIIDVRDKAEKYKADIFADGSRNLILSSSCCNITNIHFTMGMGNVSFKYQ